MQRTPQATFATPWGSLFAGRQLAASPPHAGEGLLPFGVLCVCLQLVEKRPSRVAADKDMLCAQRLPV